MFDGVPWAVENGAKASGAVARAAHYAATRGAQGIALPGDMKVSATPSPSQSVRIGTGSTTILNRQAPGESYQGLARSFTDVSVTVDGSPRTDLVIATIIDPDFSPWTVADVPDAVNGPYFVPEVLEGVDPNTTRASDVVGYSAYELARISVPASGNITSGMITSLRQLAQPRSWSDTIMQGGLVAEHLTTSDTDWKDWPSNTWTVQVPEWATDALCLITLNTVATDGVASDFNPRVYLGGLVGQSAAWDYNGGGAGVGAEKIPFPIYAQFDVTGLQGESVEFKPQAMRTFETLNTGDVWFDQYSQVVFDIRFYEKVV